MLSTQKIFPKGLLLYCDSFLFSDERKLTLGLILKVFPIFHCNSVLYILERTLWGQVYAVIQMAWLTCQSLTFLDFVIFIYRHSLQQLTINHGNFKCRHIRDDKPRLKMYDKCGKKKKKPLLLNFSYLPIKTCTSGNEYLGSFFFFFKVSNPSCGVISVKQLKNCCL